MARGRPRRHRPPAKQSTVATTPSASSLELPPQSIYPPVATLESPNPTHFCDAPPSSPPRRQPRSTNADGTNPQGTARRTPRSSRKSALAMSGQSGKWREEQILVICPGSHTTMAQLGCNELTPPAHRIPTRMFKDPESDGWRPYYTFKRKKPSQATPPPAADGLPLAAANGDDDEYEWVEDKDSIEGAVYPLQQGRVVNMPAFLAFLDHVHSMLTTTFHNTPIILMASPQWGRSTIEAITRYIFEKTKTPALSIIHSALATQYGLRWPNMTVVDVGFEKVDVTCIYDGSIVNNGAIGVRWGENEDSFLSGGEVLTQKLKNLLKDRDFTYDMAEQLKKSNICEVLPFVMDAPDNRELPTSGVAAAVVSAPDAVAADAAKPSIIVDEDEGLEEKAVDADGVLDVASIVTSGQTKEFLAKKEKEKAKAAKRSKDKESESAPKQVRLPNSKRTHNIFHYEEVREEEVRIITKLPTPPPPAAPAPAAAATIAPSTNGASAEAAPVGDVQMENSENGMPKEGATTSEPKPAEASAPADEASKPTASGEPTPAEDTKPSEDPVASAPPAAEASEVEQNVEIKTELRTKRVRRDIEIGLERFLFAEREQIDRIAAVIYHTIQGIFEMYMRPACWDHIVIVGNGSRVRGLKENILQTLTARYLISPSTATIFTSELPSNVATPTGTGSQTPTGSFTGMPHQLPMTSSGVNPLLQAATTASLTAANATPAAGSTVGDAAGASHGHFHSQTPTSIKLAQMPGYLAEWTKNGFEESMFLGCQVAGRIAFSLHSQDNSLAESQRQMSLSRVDYNELGPKGIRTHSMLR